jgi:hypothetical protein
MWILENLLLNSTYVCFHPSLFKKRMMSRVETRDAPSTHSSLLVLRTEYVYRVESTYVRSQSYQIHKRCTLSTPKFTGSGGILSVKSLHDRWVSYFADEKYPLTSRANTLSSLYVVGRRRLYIMNCTTFWSAVRTHCTGTGCF